MASTGMLLVGFLAAHLLGNLTLFADREGEAFLAYANKIHDLGPLLWVAELGLVLLFGLHIYMALRLTRQNRLARPIGYQKPGQLGESSAGSRSMVITGLAVLGFTIVHLINFRFSKGLGAPESDDLLVEVKSVLTNPLYAAIYLMGAIAIGVHLSHGFRSLFQSFGIFHTRLNRVAKIAGYALAILFALGFAAFPIVGMLVWKGDLS